MRPTYETEDDLARENAVARMVADLVNRKWPGSNIVKLHKYDSADRVIRDDAGTVTGLFEVKCRPIPAQHYPTYMIGESKLRPIWQQARFIGVPAWLFVQFTDALLCHVIAPPYRCEIGGRKDRGDPADIEIVAHIPWKLFKRVGDGAEAKTLDTVDS